MRTCVECAAALVGQQRLYCSRRCTKRAWRRDPERAERDRASARAWKDANREANRQRDREYAASLRDTCMQCGELRGAGSAKRPPGICDSCVADRRDTRREVIEHYWNMGWTLAEIAAFLDTTPLSVGVEMVHMRADGRDLPYRYAVDGNGRRQAA